MHSISRKRRRGVKEMVEKRADGPSKTEALRPTATAGAEPTTSIPASVLPPTAQQVGQVLDMTLTDGSDHLQSIYTVPISLGPPGSATTFHVQVDTGSADLWIASTSCSTSSCSGIPSSKLWSPTDTSRAFGGSEFDIEYLTGDVSGPIYWDTMSIGQYAMSNQAFSAADSVVSEPLTSNWVGVMGMAFSKDSIIASIIPPLDEVNGDEADGATVTNNMWGITPVTNAPLSRFFGVLLERPDIPASDPAYVPSQLAIGTHPDVLLEATYPLMFTTPATGYNFNSIVPVYSAYVTSSLDGSFKFWKSTLTLLSIAPPSDPSSTVNVNLPRGSELYPSVVFDTGGSVILASTAVTNAIYGSIGINPDSDGKFYIKCTTPLSMTMTIAGLPPIPLHPLDLTSSTPSPSGQCLGTIQISPQLDGSGAPGDIILGVPFLRNVYFVGRYDAFPVAAAGVIFPGATADTTNSQTPSFTLIPLTNTTLALEQFNTLRVLNRPLTGSTTQSSNSTAAGGGGGAAVQVGGKKLPIGVVVLLALIGLACIAAGLFGAWFVVQRRRMRAGKGRWAPRGEKIIPGFRDVDGSVVKAERTYSATSDTSVRTWASKRSGSFGDGEFGERGRGGHPTKRNRSKSSGDAGSRSMSGYFREPEPWEDAGAFHSPEDDGGMLPNLPPTPEMGEDGDGDGDGSEFPFPLHHRTTSELGEIRNGAAGGGGSPLLMMMPESPAPPPVVDRRYPTNDDGGRYPSTFPGHGPRRSTISTSTPPVGPVDPFSLDRIGRSQSDERYPTMPSSSSQQQLHKRDRSASSPLIPPPNPLKALVGRLRPTPSSSNDKDSPLPIFEPPPPLPILDDVPTPTLTPPPPPGAQTPPVQNVMAGVGSGGSSRMRGVLDKDLLDFNASIKLTHGGSGGDSRPFTYPPQTVNEFAASPVEMNTEDSSPIMSPSSTSMRRTTVGRPRGPRNSLSSRTSVS